MSFNTEKFFQYGVAPAIRSLTDYIGYSRQKSLALQKHLQAMKETEYQYDRRAQEQTKGFEYNKDLHEMDVEFEKVKDTARRNMLNLQANNNVWVAGQKADISIRRVGAEQQIRLEGKKRGYEYVAKSLKKLWRKDPATGEGISITSLNKSIEGLDKLMEMESSTLEKMSHLEGALAKAEKGEDTKVDQTQLEAYRKRLKTINQYREALDTQVLNYKQMGVTSGGVMSQEKQAYIFSALKNMQTMLYSDNILLSQVPQEKLIEGLQQMLPGLEIMSEDMEFIMINAAAIMKKFEKAFQRK